MNQLIMNFFIIEGTRKKKIIIKLNSYIFKKIKINLGYKEAAETFKNESDVESK